MFFFPPHFYFMFLRFIIPKKRDQTGATKIWISYVRISPYVDTL